jgi:hypothetical protein
VQRRLRLGEGATPFLLLHHDGKLERITSATDRCKFGQRHVSLRCSFSILITYTSAPRMPSRQLNVSNQLVKVARVPQTRITSCLGPRNSKRDRHPEPPTLATNRSKCITRTRSRASGRCTPNCAICGSLADFQQHPQTSLAWSGLACERCETDHD